jgi:hypothetical protein
VWRICMYHILPSFKCSMIGRWLLVVNETHSHSSE